MRIPDIEELRNNPDMDGWIQEWVDGGLFEISFEPDGPDWLLKIYDEHARLICREPYTSLEFHKIPDKINDHLTNLALKAFQGKFEP